MYGKHFASMYEGSMRGLGPEFFSVWGYVISHAKPNRNHGTTVELNPAIIGFLIGMGEDAVRKKIVQMCDEDPKSRTKDEEGRKLIQLTEYTYKVVNGDYYRSIRNEQERREYQRVKQAEYRAKKKGKSKPINGEQAFIKAGDEQSAERILMEHLPDKCQESPTEYHVETKPPPATEPTPESPNYPEYS